MSKKIDIPLLERSIRSKWVELDMKPNEKTYYIFENLYRLLKTDEKTHKFVLNLLLILNKETNYKQADKLEMIAKIEKALSELE